MKSEFKSLVHTALTSQGLVDRHGFGTNGKMLLSCIGAFGVAYNCIPPVKLVTCPGHGAGSVQLIRYL